MAEPTALGALLGGAVAEAPCRQCGTTVAFGAPVTAYLASRTLCDPCGRAARAAAAELDRQAQTQALADAATLRRAKLRVPPEFQGATVAAWHLHGTPGEREAQARVSAWARRVLTVWPSMPLLTALVGPPGTGKTRLAWALAQDLVTLHAPRVRVLALGDVLREVRATWRSSSPRTEEQVLGALRRLDLLVIDEVSAHALRSELPTLFAIISARLEHRRPTLLTSNESAETLPQLLGPALTSRLAGHGGIVRCEWGDYRVRRAQGEVP